MSSMQDFASEAVVVPAGQGPPCEAARKRQREKQIQIGKMTAGYMNYIAAVPKDQRVPDVHLSTPPTSPRSNVQLSKRAFEISLRMWRKFLHTYDEDEAASNWNHHRTYPDYSNTAQPQAYDTRCDGKEYDPAYEYPHQDYHTHDDHSDTYYTASAEHHDAAYAHHDTGYVPLPWAAESIDGMLPWRAHAQYNEDRFAYTYENEAYAHHDTDGYGAAYGDERVQYSEDVHYAYADGADYIADEYPEQAAYVEDEQAAVEAEASVVPPSPPVPRLDMQALMHYDGLTTQEDLEQHLIDSSVMPSGGHDSIPTPPAHPAEAAVERSEETMPRAATAEYDVHDTARYYASSGSSASLSSARSVSTDEAVTMKRDYLTGPKTCPTLLTDCAGTDGFAALFPSEPEAEADGLAQSGCASDACKDSLSSSVRAHEPYTSGTTYAAPVYPVSHRCRDNAGRSIRDDTISWVMNSTETPVSSVDFLSAALMAFT